MHLLLALATQLGFSVLHQRLCLPILLLLQELTLLLIPHRVHVAASVVQLRDVQSPVEPHLRLHRLAQQQAQLQSR